MRNRIEAAMLNAQLNQTSLAALMGVTPQAVQQWIKEGGTSPKGKRLAALASILKVSVEWLVTGQPEKQPGQGPLQAIPPSTEYVPIRVGNFRLQAGVNGFTVDYLDDSLAPLFFREDWLKRNNLKAEKLVACQVMGDSMEPRLYAGDTVLINTADNEPKDSSVFAVNYEGELVIKRLVRDAGQWWLSSDNPDKARYPNKLCSGDLCLLIGKVVHRQSTRI